MGLKLRYNLFRANAEDVCSAYASYYGRQRNEKIRFLTDSTGGLRVYSQDNGWVVVDEGTGWDLEGRRETYLFLSQYLWCAGFFVFVYDGEYWGYEFFDHGQVFDHFVQESVGEPIGFPGDDCRGNSRIIAEHLPFLRVEDIAPYLVQKHNWIIPEGMDIPARPGDEFRRFSECAVLDFLRMLGVAIELRDHRVQLKAPLFRSLA